jgi:hypothetical protein
MKVDCSATVGRNENGANNDSFVGNGLTSGTAAPELPPFYS